MKQITVSTFLLLVLVLFACKQPEPPSSYSDIPAPSLSVTPEIYTDITFPAHFSDFRFSNTGDLANVNISAGRVTDPGARLGRVLFYDKLLSINNTVSCGSCHKQAFGFADPVASSVGFKGAVTPRNSMTIVNPILNNHFFWDSRAESAEELALEPVQNHIEMGMEALTKLPPKLASTSYYEKLFIDAYGSPSITIPKISNALGQFLNSMVSYNSKFDKGMENDFADFTPLELKGKELFFSPKTQCSSCHADGNFAAPDGPNQEYGSGGRDLSGQSRINPKGTANIGLDVNYSDNGRQNGKFKIPSLRNIALTAPYMHDGRFETLEEVIHHYSKRIQPHQDLDGKFRSLNGNVVRLNFTPLEVESLIAFLHTLTDEQMVTDPKFSDPFLD
ncbi:MAG: cytochrome c peroxidase [Bacteroidota bacterium]